MPEVKQKHVDLVLEESLYGRLKTKAQSEQQTLNAYIVELLTQAPAIQTFEHRQVVGKTVSGKDLNADNGLVLVEGIYYRFLLDYNEQPEAETKYAIIEANGNVLTLRRI